MTPAERLAMLERKIDALLMASITRSTDTFQTLNAVSPQPVAPELAVALDLLANEGKAMIGKKAVKKRRKVSAYARRYGAAYKRLKKKHPRAQHRTLVKKAHAEARKGKK